MFYARVKEIHQPNQQKQHSNLGQSNTLPIMCILLFQRSRFMYFGLVGSQNQLCTTTLNFYWLPICFTFMPKIKWSKQLAAKCATVSWSLTQWHDVSMAQKSKQPIRCNQKHQSVFLNIFLPAENCNVSKHWKSVFDEATNIWQNFLKLCEGFVKSY